VTAADDGDTDVLVVVAVGLVDAPDFLRVEMAGGGGAAAAAAVMFDDTLDDRRIA
jgi:hypothetical protein